MLMQDARRRHAHKSCRYNQSPRRVRPPQRARNPLFQPSTEGAACLRAQGARPARWVWGQLAEESASRRQMVRRFGWRGQKRPAYKGRVSIDTPCGMTCQVARGAKFLNIWQYIP